MSYPPTGPQIGYPQPGQPGYPPHRTSSLKLEQMSNTVMCFCSMCSCEACSLLNVTVEQLLMLAVQELNTSNLGLETGCHK
jgi:hypothetical protein